MLYMSGRRKLIFYSKPGCCLCATLEAKLRTIQPVVDFELEIRDITTDPDWFSDFQYTIPVLEIDGRTVSAVSHRSSLESIQTLLEQTFHASARTS